MPHCPEVFEKVAPHFHELRVTLTAHVSLSRFSAIRHTIYSTLPLNGKVLYDGVFNARH